MAAALVSVEKLLERLCREEKTLKDHGLYAQANGMRSAITILLRESQAPSDSHPPPLDPSS